MSKTIDVDDAVKGGASWEQLIAGADPMLIPATKVQIPADAELRPDEDTQLRLLLNRQGYPESCYANSLLVLRHDPRWAKLEFNSLINEIMLERKAVAEEQITGDVNIFLARVYGMKMGPDMTKTAIETVAKSRRFHPVQEYLNGLVWDGELRIPWVMEKVLGVESTRLVEAYMRRFLIAAVARALSPGCKVDTGLVLVGKQGARKSTFFNTLFGEWYNDSPIQVGSKEAFILLNACWGYEVAELSDMHKATAEAVKQFMSSPVDTYRGVFAKWAARNPRQSIICASTNKPEFLVDDTGSRRFWPVTVPGAIDIELLKEWRDQLWAEAVAWYRKGEQWWLTPEEEELRKADATNYSDDDPWEREVHVYLAKNGPIPVNISDILDELKIPIERQGMRESRRVAAILRKKGWSRKTTPQAFVSRFGPKSYSKD